MDGHSNSSTTDSDYSFAKRGKGKTVKAKMPYFMQKIKKDGLKSHSL